MEELQAYYLKCLWPLLGVVAIAPLSLVRKFIRIRRLKALRQRTLAAQQQPDFDHTNYTELAKSMSCQPFSESEIGQLVESRQEPEVSAEQGRFRYG